METDIRDAKRRISLVKRAVPKQKAKPTHGSASEAGSGDESESGSGGDWTWFGLIHRLYNKCWMIQIINDFHWDLPWGSKSSKFTNLVNLLKVKNLLYFFTNFLEISKFCEKSKPHQNRIKTASKLRQNCVIFLTFFLEVSISCSYVSYFLPNVMIFF